MGYTPALLCCIASIQPAIGVFREQSLDHCGIQIRANFHNYLVVIGVSHAVTVFKTRSICETPVASRGFHTIDPSVPHT